MLGTFAHQPWGTESFCDCNVNKCLGVTAQLWLLINCGISVHYRKAAEHCILRMLICTILMLGLL